MKNPLAPDVDLRLVTVKLSDVRKSKFRDFKTYPFIEEKLEALEKSIRETGWWANVLARSDGDGVELTHGHHRIEAARRVLGKGAEVKVLVGKFSDDEAFKLFAHENMAEYSSGAFVEIETVRALVLAFSRGEVHLPAPYKDTAAKVLRYAPSFVVGGTGGAPPRTLAYSADTVNQFLGWSGQRVKDALQTLALDEAKTIDVEKLRGISKDAVQRITTEVATAVRFMERDEKPAADIQREARRYGEGIATKVRAGEMAARDIPLARPEQFKSKEKPDLSRFGVVVAEGLMDVPSPALAAKLAQIVEWKRILSPKVAGKLQGELRAAAIRLERWAKKLDGAGADLERDVERAQEDRFKKLTGGAS